MSELFEQDAVEAAAEQALETAAEAMQPAAAAVQDAAAAVQQTAGAAVQEAPIHLTMDPFAAAPAAPDIPLAETAVAMAADRTYDDSMLTEEEKQMVKDFASQIDVTNTAQVLQYGAGAQAKVASFSEKALDNVKTKDLGEVGGLITNVVTELKGFDVDEEQKGILGFFKKKANDLNSLKIKYDKADANINKIVEALEKHQVTLMKDTATLDQLYNLNLTYYKELTMYILAGKQKL